MFDLTSKIIKWFTEPISEPLRKSPEMVKAHTEAEILKAEEDFEAPRISSLKNPRGSVRLVPRHYPDENEILAHGQSHTARGPVWDIRSSSAKAGSAKKTKRKKP